MSDEGEPTPSAHVVEVDLRRLRLHLLHPHVAAHGTEHDREVVLARVRLAGGAAGWGECSALAAPGYTAEHLDGAWRVLRDVLAPALVAGSAAEAEGHPMARAALADAVLDAQLVAVGRSLADHLGAGPGPVDTCTVISITDSLDDLLAAVAAAPGAVKLKVRPGWDVEPVRAVREAFPDRWLAADANRSFGADDLVRLRPLADAGLRYLEQPAGGLDVLHRFRAALGTPICLDESVTTREDLQRGLAAEAIDVLNVKPARVGGVEAAARLVADAAAAGLDAFVGGMLESGVGRSGALAVAALAGCTLPTDLGPSARYWAEDVTEAIEADPAGHLLLPAGPGTGRAPVPDRLDALTVDRVVLR